MSPAALAPLGNPGEPRDVIVVGSINVDLMVRCEKLPQPGETVSGGRFERHFGGKGANQAVAAARSGARVMFVGAVGDDAFGTDSVVDLDAEGIETAAILRMAHMSTGIAAIMVDERGENQIAVASGANMSLDAQRVERAFVGRTFPRDGVCVLSFEVPDAPLVRAARLAREAGIRVLMCPAPVRPIPADIVATNPILVMNALESIALATAMTGKPLATHPEAAAALSDLTKAPVVITLGSKGALLYERGRLTPFPAYEVPVVDTTGAGDTLVGVMAAEMARGVALPEATRRAVAGAGLSVGVAGPREGAPTREAIDSFLVTAKARG